MSGASSRRRGHDYERLCARYLGLWTGLGGRVVTTRSLGANYGADLATVTDYDAKDRPVLHEPAVLDFSIECKAVQPRDRCPRAWLRQASEQAAPGLTPVVLWKRPYKSWGEGSAFLMDDSAPRGWTEQPISEWVEGLTP